MQLHVGFTHRHVLEFRVDLTVFVHPSKFGRWPGSVMVKRQPGRDPLLNPVFAALALVV